MWREEELAGALLAQLGWELFDHERFVREIQRVEIDEGRMLLKKQQPL